MGQESNEVETVLSDDYREERFSGSGNGGVSENAEPVLDEEAQIRIEIERTRAGMSQTIDALQQRLAPERIVEQVKVTVQEQAAEALDSAKHAVRQATIGKAEKLMEDVSDSVYTATRNVGIAIDDSSILRTIRDNPVPFVLIGAGLGMLAMRKSRATRDSYQYNNTNQRYPAGYAGGYAANRQDLGRAQGTGYAVGPEDTFGNYGFSEGTREASDEPGYYASAKEAVGNMADTAKDSVASAAGTIRDSVSSAAGTIKNSVSSVAGTIQETAGSVADTAREKAAYLSQQAQQKARQASDTLDSTLQDYPLAVGLAALAAGAAFGLAFPSTRIENQYMGRAREQFVEKAQTAAQETVEKVQRVAQEAGRKIEEEAEHQGLTSPA